jgi:histidinol-phosphate aminotransferase
LIATLFGARTVETPSPDYQQDLEAILDAIAKTRLIFIPNPNNPTGALISQSTIDGFIIARRKTLLSFSDEAYFEFIDNSPTYPRPRRQEYRCSAHFLQNSRTRRSARRLRSRAD